MSSLLPSSCPALSQSDVVRYRHLAINRKRGGDRRMREQGQEEQERAIVEQTDALVLFTFCFVCLDRASLRAGRPKIHADQWKSLEALIDFVKERAKRKGFEVPWALW